jgi:DNA helicase HerA-like ATPase
VKLRGISCECEKRAEIKLREASSAKGKDIKKATQLQQEAEKLNDKAREGLSRGWILIDEAHNYIPQVGIIGSKGPLKKFVNEGRNIGLSIAVTTQQPSGLDSAIRRNADILIVHSITMKSDIEVTENMLNTAVPSDFEVNKKTISANVFERMARGLQIGYAIISCPNANRIFVSKIRPRVSAHGGTEY